MPRFNPSDHEEKESFEVPTGDYPFAVFAAEEQMSSKDNEMINLELHVDIGRDKPLMVYDYLVFTPKALWKVKSFCDANGIDFQSGELNAVDCEGLEGKVNLALGEPNNQGKRYMQVEYYCKPEGFSEEPKSTKPKVTTETATNEVPLDDIPF